MFSNIFFASLRDIVKTPKIAGVCVTAVSSSIKLCLGVQIWISNYLKHLSKNTLNFFYLFRVGTKPGWSPKHAQTISLLVQNGGRW